MTLPSTTLGKNGPSVPAMGIGLMSIGHAYGHAGTDEERLAFLDGLHAMGETFWDNADIYGDAEDVVGKWFAANPDKRKDIFLSTKFGFVDPTSMPMIIRSDPEYIEGAVERSLKRHQTDYIDLYYCHRVDDKTPVEVTMRTLVKLKEQGKIRHIGLSEVTLNDLKRAHAVHPVAAVETEYSPWALECETNGVLDFCQNNNITLVAYSPLGRGFLTGQIRSPEDVKGDARSMFPRFYPENFQKNFDVVEKLEKIAAKKGVKAGQLGLAWLMKQGHGTGILPIFGTRTLNRVEENLVGLDIQLTPEEEKEIREVVDKAGAGGDFGDRYPQGMEQLQLRETPKE